MQISMFPQPAFSNTCICKDRVSASSKTSLRASFFLSQSVYFKQKLPLDALCSQSPHRARTSALLSSQEWVDDVARNSFRCRKSLNKLALYGVALYSHSWKNKHNNCGTGEKLIQFWFADVIFQGLDFNQRSEHTNIYIYWDIFHFSLPISGYRTILQTAGRKSARKDKSWRKVIGELRCDKQEVNRFAYHGADRKNGAEYFSRLMHRRKRHIWIWNLFLSKSLAAHVYSELKLIFLIWKLKI